MSLSRFSRQSPSTKMFWLWISQAFWAPPSSVLSWPPKKIKGRLQSGTKKSVLVFSKRICFQKTNRCQCLCHCVDVIVFGHLFWCSSPQIRYYSVVIPIGARALSWANRVALAAWSSSDFKHIDIFKYYFVIFSKFCILYGYIYIYIYILCYLYSLSYSFTTSWFNRFDVQ